MKDKWLAALPTENKIIWKKTVGKDKVVSILEFPDSSLRYRAWVEEPQKRTYIGHGQSLSQVTDKVYRMFPAATPFGG